MLSSNYFALVAGTLLATLQFVFAGPGGYVVLINGTPYDWKLTYNHSYHMDWKPASTIASGTAYEQYTEYFYLWSDNGDCAAEVVYELAGSPVPASFTLQARQKNGRRIQIQYHDKLSSLNNPENSLIDIGWEHNGAVPFVLAGSETGKYVSSNPPIAWMQGTFPTIGSKTLREFSMPASHDSGMSELRRYYGGIDHNTKTQSHHVYDQLKFGARYLDIRPVYRHGEWFTGHFTQLGKSMFGAMGRTIPDIINDINYFNSEYPGELIIIELSHEEDDEPSKWVNELSTDEWDKLYTLFSTINDPWIPQSKNLPEDVTQIPLSNFIQPGSPPAVLIRVPDKAPPPPSSIPHPQLFIKATNLPYYGSYSDTESPSKLTIDQTQKILYYRDIPASSQPPLRSTWTITQGFIHAFSILEPYLSIIGLSVKAKKELYGELWGFLMGEGKGRWPNWVETDDLRDWGATSWCMGVNEYLVKGAGEEGGRGGRTHGDGGRGGESRRKRWLGW